MADRRITRADAEALPQNSEHWHFGILYACQEDPRVVVRHRQLIGWSWNQANPWTIPAMLAVGLALLGPAWFLVQRGAIGTALATATLIAVPVVLLVHWNASGPRP